MVWLKTIRTLYVILIWVMAAAQGILQWAGLVKIEKKGRETYCYADPEGLLLIDQWIEKFRKSWMSIPGAIDDYFNQ